MASIRFATPDDIDDIYKIYCDRYDSNDDPSMVYSKKDWNWYLSNGSAIIILLENDGIIVGFLFAYDMGIWGYVEHIVVDKNHRGKNYGKMLIDEITKIGKSRKWRLVESCYYSEIKEMETFFQKANWEDGGINTRWVFKIIQ